MCGDCIERVGILYMNNQAIVRRPRWLVVSLVAMCAINAAALRSLAETVTVTGDFDAGKLVQAFEDAGFHVKAEAK